MLVFIRIKMILNYYEILDIDKLNLETNVMNFKFLYFFYLKVGQLDIY